MENIPPKYGYADSKKYTQQNSVNTPKFNNPKNSSIVGPKSLGNLCNHDHQYQL